MKLSLFVLIGAGIIALGFVSGNKPVSKQAASVIINGSYDAAVILELFTSEGCSSCPPADQLLPELAKLDSNIIPLSFHVDYWNRLGWTDPFSSSEFTDRQGEYVSQFNLESSYTPQLVVNGQYEMVGSDRADAESDIKKSLEVKSLVSLSITDVRIDNNKIRFTVNAYGDIKKMNLLSALVQKHAATKVRSGENRGATLSHINIVRSLSKHTAAAKNEIELIVPADLISTNWQLVVYMQQRDLKITGASLFNPDK